jgi:5'-3' exonuclease
MGIPSYFSHIIKNYGTIIQKSLDMTRNNVTFERLYMDCNSLLYDSYRELSSYDNIENDLISNTIERIEYYIEKIRPTGLIYIAFDGVAPFAKMEQQRTRRYKSYYESNIFCEEDVDGYQPFTTSMFTPGTEFMKKLSIDMKKHFGSNSAPRKYGVKSILIATPDEPGEGEHKLFEHLRKHPMLNINNAAVYGLDADLIMLSLFHLKYAQNLYIFRELPAFAHVLLQRTKVDEKNMEPCFLDIQKLGNYIASTMECSAPHPHRMNDYVFLCFLLGNDFLPHFPALNIRTNGIQRILDVYGKMIGNKPHAFLLTQTTPPTIVWSQLSIFLKELSKHEYGFIKQEYATRKRWNNRTPQTYPKTTLKERQSLFQDSPILFRHEENYICPEETFWEERYYQRLLSSTHKNVSKEQINDIAINYLEGLEWVLAYYVQGCPDWKWKYHYNYPPLLKDLHPIVPQVQTTFFQGRKKVQDNQPFHPSTQLMYVLPPYLHDALLSKRLANVLRDKYSEYFLKGEKREDMYSWKFQWAFCRYFWECHIQTPEIPIEILDQWDRLHFTNES